MGQNRLFKMTVAEMFAAYPYAEDFFAFLPVRPQPELVLADLFARLDEDYLEELGLSRAGLIRQFTEFMGKMEEISRQPEPVTSITILGGHDKDGVEENLALTIEAGEIVCIVGPTGSGKSRLLADIEWLAQRDTPTNRQILINGRQPDSKRRFAVEQKLVAQISQNMNFVMDLTAAEFVHMHAESRMVEHLEAVTANVLEIANQLAGEKFRPDTPVTALSGGQSRALMIADAAFLSVCPIVLIDELENAGIDRRQALQLLTAKQKIVFMATHDPILALMGERRMVIKNGGISKIIATSRQERANLARLEKLDLQLSEIREALRRGEKLGTIAFAFD
ncbi:ABC transporter ATP-binding protein|uniref:ABC-type lipoprotein export system, ATPase component n=1 Tax=Dendrosporobacter quercicolus TaxID=146817 RepID=A0A1G9TA23_9FIRM|nr:ABC transporter ATP-binding protein [Dendrosporobacter quercicolus]NSL48539.1 ABC transporter ATP-binding protein [Dendrosporobacter quercicolus DSM 1736]SDM43955.1 ABC-type lipoprotein export system, ATPase component [Dendrosporobacter quercicolus]